ncbi:MAG: AEC family transporter [Beutenbergiaceae bacterium]
MIEILTLLGSMAAVAFVGWLLAHLRVLGPGAEVVLARVVFTVATPALLIVTIASSDLHLLLTRNAVTTFSSTLAVAALAVALLRWALRRDAGQSTVGALSASYLNAGNLGLPLAVYLFADPVIVVPTILVQLLVLAPAAFAVLESRGGGRSRWHAVRRGLGRSVRNPIILATLIGVALALLPFDPPLWVQAPLRLIGGAAAPLALLTLGMALALPREAAGKVAVSDLTLVVTLRVLVHPALAWTIGAALGLTGEALYAVVVMAALPTAQNVLVYALRYGVGRAIARDSQLITTALTVPLLIVISALLS